MSHQLTEVQISLIDACLQARLPAALADVDAARADHNVSTEPPSSYFWYPRAEGFTCPAVFIIADDFPIELSEGPNFIKAKCRVMLEVLLEDRNRHWLTVRCWRYQAALSSILVNLELVSADNKLKLIIKQKAHRFTPVYTNIKNEESDEAAFRKSVVIELEVEHYESF